MAIVADYIDKFGTHIIINNQYAQCSPEERAKRLERINEACIAVLESAARNKKKQSELNSDNLGA